MLKLEVLFLSFFFFLCSFRRLKSGVLVINVVPDNPSSNVASTTGGLLEVEALYQLADNLWHALDPDAVSFISLFAKLNC